MTDGGTNAPLEVYTNKQDIAALCDSLTLDVENWESTDLERILLLRDGFYSIRQSLRDKGDEAEHSVDRVISAMDRLYADLERALREIKAADMVAAQEKLAALRRGAHIHSASAAPSIQTIRTESAEVLAKAHSTSRSFELNLIKIENVSLNVEVLKKARLQIKRFSASVFAIKLYLEQEIIFEGVFKFLTEGADRVIDELKEILGKLKTSYQKTTQFVEELGGLVEKGGRFVRMVGDFIEKVFDDSFSEQAMEVEIKMITSHRGPPILSAAFTGTNNVTVGGKAGILQTIDQRSYRVIADRLISGGLLITSLALYKENLLMGTSDGLKVVAAQGQAQRDYVAPYQEHVTAVVANKNGIFTGSRDGYLRHWTLAGHLSRLGDLRLGRSIQKLLCKDDLVLAAAGEGIHRIKGVPSSLEPINVGFRIDDFALFRGSSLIACGAGKIEQVNLERGVYQRYITSQHDEHYTCVAVLDDDIFLIGTESGQVIAMDFDSGVEIGKINVGFTLRGLLLMQNGRVLAYGGSWSGEGRNVAILTTSIKSEIL
jgi:hypothetical protein